VQTKAEAGDGIDHLEVEPCDNVIVSAAGQFWSAVARRRVLKNRQQRGVGGQVI